MEKRLYEDTKLNNGITSALEDLRTQIEESLDNLEITLVKQGHKIEVHPLMFRCPECQAIWAGEANYAKHLLEEHSYTDEAVYVDLENQKLYYETGLVDLERLLEEYTDARLDLHA